MTYAATLETVKTGILLHLANSDHTHGLSKFADSRFSSFSMIYQALKPTKIYSCAFDRHQEWQEGIKIDNPYCCRDESLIHEALAALNREGCIEIDSYPRNLPHYYLTAKGAAAIGEEDLSEQLAQRGRSRNVSEKASAALPQTTISVSEINGILDTVLGRDSPEAREIMERIHNR